MRILVVKLSDIGDVLSATPALRMLRRSFPEAHITALISPHTREVLEGSGLVDDIVAFNKSLFDKPGGLINPMAFLKGMALLLRLRRDTFDTIVFMHHLTTPWGARKYALLSLAAGASERVGLDNGRGWFLTKRVADGGFGARHEVEYWVEVVKLLGAEGEPGPLEISISHNELEFASRSLPSDSPLVAIHPGSGTFSTARRWPLDNFIKVARTLAREDGARIVLVGGPDERELAQEITRKLDTEPVDLVGRTRLKELAAVLSRCQLLVCNDGGVMHLATAMGTPVAVVFGPSNHNAWGPWTPEGANGNMARVIRHSLPCSPCFYVGLDLGYPEGCPARSCLHAVTPEEVITVAREMLHLGIHETSPVYTGNTTR